MQCNHAKESDLGQNSVAKEGYGQIKNKTREFLMQCILAARFHMPVSLLSAH